MNIPDWYEIILLSLAAWRVFQLLAHDDILDRPRRYVTRAGDARQGADGTWVNVPKDYREALAEWLECPFCFGFWIALAWWGAWLVWPYETLVAAVPFVLSAGVVAASKVLTSES